MGVQLLISKWYKRDELGQRTAYLSCGLLIANAIGSLLASGILKVMDNVHGISAWRWLFYTEGLLTILVGFWALYVLPDFPQTSSGWLSPAEKALAVLRTQEEYSPNYYSETDLERPLSGFWLAISDWKVWWLALTLGVMAWGSSFHFYFPTLMQTIGYGPVTTLLICVPPWITATIVVILMSRYLSFACAKTYH